jgi:NADH-quinone oxidoreductase subunit D
MPIKTEPTTINLGPQHPSTHGVFRLRVSFDGEVVVDVEPVFGYLHRGTEKLAEERTFNQIVTLTDRLDYESSMTNNLAYVEAVEKLAGVSVPERAQYLRVLVSELQRIATHLIFTGFFLQELGVFGTLLMYCFRERESVLDLFEMICGARITVSYMRPGGVTQDAPPEFWIQLNDLINKLPHLIDDLENLITDNEIVIARTKNIGVLSPQIAIESSVTGPILRASGINWDIRKANPYESYGEMDFNIPTGSNGDSFDRYLVRIKEIRESIKIIKQCIKSIPNGIIKNPETPFFLRPECGDVYSSIESPRGELGFYLVSDGGIAPYRCKIRSPSFINLTVLKSLLIGWKMSDLIVIFGSLAVNMGEVDR